MKHAHTITPEVIDRSYPWAYFDGSTQENGCGGGAILYISDKHYYKLKMGLGRGTNKFVELNNLGHQLIFSLEKNCNKIQIFGDSKIVINWIQLCISCHVHTLRGLLDEVTTLKLHFYFIVCSHIYRKMNHISNFL